MPPYVILNKKRGQTPLEAITSWKEEHPEYANVPASYAGRLDPMAQGKLLVLLGEECKRQEAYRGLDKEYVIELALDLNSDTGDVLGLATYANVTTNPAARDITRASRELIGAHVVPYPIYSSKTVNGKPLFLYALEGTLDTIHIPEHTETLYDIQLPACSDISRDDLFARIMQGISVVPDASRESQQLGRNFRIEEVREQWRHVFSTIPERRFCILTMRITCASGTYMRSFANRLASQLGTSATILSIDRTRIGTFRSLGVISFWQKQY